MVYELLLKEIEYYFSKCDKNTLKNLCFLVGASQTGAKKILQENVISQFKLLSKLLQKRDNNNEVSIIAIDMGVENFGYSKFIWSLKDDVPILIDWNKIKLSEKFLSQNCSKIPIHPEIMGVIAYNVTEFLTKDFVDAIFIERQRTRTLGSSSINEPVLKVNIMEHLLYTNLKYRLHYLGKPDEYILESSSPKRMVDYWCSLIPVKSIIEKQFSSNADQAKKKINSSSLSKRIRISLVRSLLNDQVYSNRQKFKKFKLSEKLTEVMHQYNGNRIKIDIPKALNIDSNQADGSKSIRSNKNDDLSDSLLHGLAWIDWLKNYNEIIKFIKKNEDNSIDEFKDLISSLKLKLEDFSTTCIERV